MHNWTSDTDFFGLTNRLNIMTSAESQKVLFHMATAHGAAAQFAEAL